MEKLTRSFATGVDSGKENNGCLIVTADDDRGLHVPCRGADGSFQSFSPGKSLAADTVINWRTRVNARGVVEKPLQPNQCGEGVRRTTS